jgi:uncharacterized membrane protein YbhN (UPF0104 family)
MRRIFHWLSTAFGIAVFITAIVVLRNQLRGHPPADILTALHAVPSERIALAFILTLLCYASYTGYDFLALKALRKQLPLKSVWLNSFICHALSVNTGFTSLLCGTMRCQYYLRKGLQPREIVRLILHCSLTYWLGFLALGSIIFYLLPAPPLGYTRVGPWLHPLGAACAIIVVAYVIISVIRTKPVKIGKLTIPVARTSITIGQIIVSALEWILGTAVLYALLPPHPEFSYLHLLGYYFVAQALVLFSQVPSGIGVFESVVLTLTPSDLDRPIVLAALLIYRVVFNMIPLCIGGMLLWIRAYVRHREKRKEDVPDVSGSMVPL